MLGVRGLGWRCWTSACCSRAQRRAIDRVVSGSRRCASTRVAGKGSSSPSDLRNVSFWGHIDAGKTTLTERVLYLAKALSPPTASAGDGGAGRTASSQLPGDVDSGSTVTDFLEAERERGITIQSAAVGPFSWQPKEALEGVPESKITLIDTPGHIDFTIEVERSLRVADGCVILIDGVEGVESQTESVWQIAKRYHVRSHVVFVNKLDRVGSSLAHSVRSIVTSGIHSRPTILQLPIFAHDASSANESPLVGTIDLTSNPTQACFYGGRAGEVIDVCPLEDAMQKGRVSESLGREARRGREALVETLGSLDEELLDQILAISADLPEGANANEHVPTQDLRAAIRRQSILGEVLPVLCGSAQKEIGIQAVLDAINHYLPAPNEAGDTGANQSRGLPGGCVWGSVGDGNSSSSSSSSESSVEKSSRTSISLTDADLSLLAFKVVWDKQKGPMTFVRLYSGSLQRGSTLFNTTTQTKERLSKILFAYADRYVEADSLQAGQVGVLLGLKDTRTGDTLMDHRAASAATKKSAGSSSATPWANKSSTLRLRRVDVPLPVFSVSLEPMGKADEGQVREAIEMLIRTDPSLRIDYGEANGSGADGTGLGSAGTGQIVLSGMGELHLEIAKDRLLNEFKARAVMGHVRVSYRETIAGTDDMDAAETTWHVEELDREVMGKKLKASCEIGIRALAEGELAENDDNTGGNVIRIELINSVAAEGQDGDSFESGQMRNALRAGLVAAMSRGPLSWNAIMGLHITLRNLETFGPQLSTSKALMMLATQALNKAVKSRKMAMMEPVMKVKIQCDEQYLGKVSSVLSNEQNGIVDRVDHAIGKTESQSALESNQVYLPHEGDGASSSLNVEDRGRIACSIYATVPLVKLVNYSSKLRAITKGSGTFEMSLHGFTIVTAERETEILTELGRL